MIMILFIFNKPFILIVYILILCFIFQNYFCTWIAHVYGFIIFFNAFFISNNLHKIFI